MAAEKQASNLTRVCATTLGIFCAQSLPCGDAGMPPLENNRRGEVKQCLYFPSLRSGLVLQHASPQVVFRNVFREMTSGCNCVTNVNSDCCHCDSSHCFDLSSCLISSQRWLFAMTATLTAPAEALLREQVANGQFSSGDSAVEAAIQTVFGCRASQALESLLNPGRRLPVSELWRMQV